MDVNSCEPVTRGDNALAGHTSDKNSTAGRKVQRAPLDYNIYRRNNKSVREPVARVRYRAMPLPW